jgi:hypothetical protein
LFVFLDRTRINCRSYSYCKLSTNQARKNSFQVQKFKVDFSFLNRKRIILLL